RDDWRYITYGAFQEQVDRVASWAIRNGFDADTPTLILSENTVEHALLSFGLMAAGAWSAPISPGYSLMSETFDKLKHVHGVVKPKAIFVQDGQAFAPALRALDLTGVTVIAAKPTPDDIPSLSFADLVAQPAGDEVAAAMAALTPDTVAKVLFTSGSTGMPKGVLQHHGMMATAIAARLTVTIREDHEPDTVWLDWLPWSHSFGGNANLLSAIAQGGTFHIDHGKPLPGAFNDTLDNLHSLSPTQFSTTPSAFGLLITALENDEKLAEKFFHQLKMVSYGGAALPTDLYERMQQVAIRTTGERIRFNTGYGATETGPAITNTYFPTDRVGLLGLPLPGCQLKLVPHGDDGSYEIRVKAPYVTKGYLNNAEKTAAAFDEDGWYCIGDAAKFVDPAKPELGLLFDGRVAEEFKLLTGTFVSVGKLRLQVVAAGSPYIRDAVITGHDRNYVGALIWLNEDKARALTQMPDATVEEVIKATALHNTIAGGLRAHNVANPGSSTTIRRVILMAEPPSADGHEITDKGYINQRATLQRRHKLVESLYNDPAPEGVIEIPRQ
ncbi:MAG: AMP-binding protein, partial [Alphaproteobacteria bacterium]